MSTPQYPLQMATELENCAAKIAERVAQNKPFLGCDMHTAVQLLQQAATQLRDLNSALKPAAKEFCQLKRVGWLYEWDINGDTMRDFVWGQREGRWPDRTLEVFIIKGQK